MGHDRTGVDERVLIVAPTRRDAEVTREILGEAAVETVAFRGLAELAGEMRRGAGAVVLADAVLADPGMATLLAGLADQPPWSDIPVLLLTRHKEYPYAIRRTLDALTNLTLLELPVSTRAMVSAVESALRSRQRQYEMRDRIGRQAEAEEALREADRRKDEFLATLAHELRNPLATIRNCLPLLARGPAMPEQAQRYVGMMDRQSRLLVKLIDDLLDVSRISTGKVALRRERLDLRSVVESALETSRPAVEAARHDVRVEQPEAPVWVQGDLERLCQVVSNILGNAVKYTPDGGTISVSLGSETGEAVIRVADNGAGLPADMLPHVFEIFTQVNRTLDRSQGGLGIGLSLVKRLTELHGGSVVAASEGVDRGSTFTLRLPLDVERRGGAAGASDDGAAEPAAAAPLKLLVVDDNADAAESLSALLRADGHETRTEYGGTAGLVAAAEFDPDVVLCDVGMPGMDGNEVARRLRLDPRFASTLLVAVTGWGDPEQQRRTRESGFDLHLTKPVGPEAILSLLAGVAPAALTMDVVASVFKAYDIRGVVGESIDAAFAEHLGRAFGSAALAEGERAVAVGRDGRLSGPALAAALVRGLASTGLDVVDLGPVTTPMLYYVAATRERHGCRSGVMVTGSHNPKDYNGFKMVLAGRAIHGDEIQRLRRRIEAEDYARGEGRAAAMDVGAEYSARIVGDCRLARPMTIAVDSGNGIAGASAPGVLRALGCTVHELYSEVDGNFPNHHPDPSKPENLAELIEFVRSGDAELGLAFDGDGDRLGVVTKDGQIIYPDRQLMLFARDVLKRRRGATILFDVKCSQRLAPLIRDAGGEPLMWKTGHSLVKAKMREVGSPLAGEMSGHIFFGERWYGFDDATYTAARLLEIVSASADPSAVLNALPTSHSTPELNVACAEGEPARVVERLRAEARFEGAREVVTIDGVRVEYDDGFGLVRASNTTPVLVLRFEGTSEAALARIQAACMAALLAVKPDARVAAAAH